MARPAKFQQANFVWRGLPADEKRGEVADLPAHLDRERYLTTSCWELTAGELAEVLRTGRVWVQVFGRQPPVYITGHDPFAPTAEE